MKLGDIKAEALRLMFVNFNYNISANDITRLASDETYGSYIVNMNGSINRGLDVMERKGVIARSSVRLPSYIDYASVAASEAENSELDIQEQTARILPFYIKSELMSEDDPSAAREARGLFEQALQDISASSYASQERVMAVYEGNG